MQPELPPLALNAWLRWAVVAGVIKADPPQSLVEIGCGQGGFGVRLATVAKTYRGYEPDAVSFQVAAGRLAPISAATVYNEALPSDPDSQSDLVCAFEVLEHIEDDVDALRAWSQWIKPGGRLLISVPAHQNRFGPWDRAVGHHRRYGRSDLGAVLTEAGLTVERIVAYGFPLGYALEWVRNRLAPPPEGGCEEQTGQSGRLLQPTSWMRSATQLATWPFRMLQRLFASTNLGTGWVAVARRLQ